jgi:hypothetical protein
VARCARHRAKCARVRGWPGPQRTWAPTVQGGPCGASSARGCGEIGVDGLGGDRKVKIPTVCRVRGQLEVRRLRRAAKGKERRGKVGKERQTGSRDGENKSLLREQHEKQREEIERQEGARRIGVRKRHMRKRHSRARDTQQLRIASNNAQGEVHPCTLCVLLARAGRASSELRPGGCRHLHSESRTRM